MTTWQWRVILALCRIVLRDVLNDGNYRVNEDDINMLRMALLRGEDIGK
jgi:hypothetical protein